MQIFHFTLIYFLFLLVLLFLCYFLFITANKKAKLINGTLSIQHPESTSTIDDTQTYSLYDRANSRPGGPNLVNKQLVLPFVPPSFPNGLTDGSNHLIKPSEYLKSISDKRSGASSSGR